MKPLVNSLLRTGIVFALVAGAAACNRTPDASPGTAAATTAGQATAAPAAAPVAAPVPVQAEPAAAPAAAPPPGRDPDYARVLAVDPVRANGAPQRVCQDVVVTQQVQPRDPDQVAGTAIGAVLGGVLGNAVGHGRGRTLAAVAGAVGGGYAGRRIEQDRQEDHVVQTVQQRCHNVAGQSQVVAYDVRYVYDGVQRTVRLDHDPGDLLPMRDGVVALPDVR